MSLKGNLSSLANFSARLRELPKVVGLRIAEKAAPALTELARATFNAGADPQGVTWAPGSEGQHITLRKSGDLERYVKYVAIGTKLRIALGTAYAKYQIGKRAVFPRQGEGLPTAYVQTLKRIAAATIREHLGVSR